MSEFPELNEYKLCVKPRYYGRLQVQWEENNKKNSEKENVEWNKGKVRLLKINGIIQEERYIK